MITKEKIERICFEEILGLWESLPNSFPDFLTEVGELKKRQNEAEIEEIAGQWKVKAKAFPKKESEQLAWKQEMDGMLAEFFAKEQLLGIRSHMSEETFQAFQEETKRFVRKVRSFDPELTMENIWQALRNYFIYAVIADLQGQKQACKETVFCYSLLYPYTDNYIDEKRHTRQQKEAYNCLISNVLHDVPVTPKGSVEEKTCKLLHGLVDSYAGEKKKEIQNLLLWMLEAQNNSIRQQEHEPEQTNGGEQANGVRLEHEPEQANGAEVTREEILRISAYKGSLSVLIDYFFTIPELREEEVRFYMKFGFFLQLADDLQDRAEDQKNGFQTLMVFCKNHGGLEKGVNRLLHYVHTVFEEFTPVNDKLKYFMLEHCYSLVIGAAMTDSGDFSGKYLERLEQFFPVHMEYMQKQRKVPGKNEKQVQQFWDKYGELLLS